MPGRWDSQWKPYVSGEARKAQARIELRRLEKLGLAVQPVEILGRKIVSTFWGLSWCEHLESFSDFENRLPRGRTYVRNGSVCHLDITRGEISAFVSGSAIYTVNISVKRLEDAAWDAVKLRCSGQIGSMLELLQGRLSDSVMSVVTDRQRGLFPVPAEINMRCSCPDIAKMCKHIAAVLYGVGARFDQRPELLFLLRGVDHEELVSAKSAASLLIDTGTAPDRRRLNEGDLGDIFGIDLLSQDSTEATASIEKVRPRAPSEKLPVTLTSDNNKKSSAAASKGKITGKTIRDLRAKLELTRAQLATLLNVSATTISGWEKQRGMLNLHQRSFESLQAAMSLTKSQALKKIRTT